MRWMSRGRDAAISFSPSSTVTSCARWNVRTGKEPRSRSDPTRSSPPINGRQPLNNVNT